MTRRTLGGLGSAVVLAVVAMGFVAPPALAQAPTITWNAAERYTGTVGISGQATMPGGSSRVDSVTVSMSSAAGHPVPDPQPFAGNGTNTRSFSIEPSLPYNGVYTVTASAVGRDGPVPDFDSPETSSISRTFSLSARPAPPASLKASVNQTKRTVTLSWTESPEPDVFAYGVYREFDDGTLDAGTVVEGKKTTTYTHQLGSLPADTYRYQVLAVRPNADGTQPLASDPAVVSAKVTSSPPTTSTTKPAGGGGGTGGGTRGGGTATTTTSGSGSGSPTLATRGKADLSGFAALLPSGGAKLPAGTRTPTTEPEGSFEEDLPFGARGEGGSGSSDDDSESALGEESLASSSGDDRPTSLLFMASGLLVTVVLMHLLWLRDEVNREPLPAIEPAEDPSS